MGCKKPSELQDISKKVQNKWINDKTLERYGFNEDPYMFQQMFDTVTGKLFEAGSSINSKDMKKMDIAIDGLIKDLKNPGILNNKIIDHIFIGRAAARRNPITARFYESITRANNFRSTHSSIMTENYNGMLSFLKEAILEYDGLNVSDYYGAGDNVGTYKVTDLAKPGKVQANRKANKRFAELNKKESAVYNKLKKGGSAGASAEMIALKEFLGNEGAVFQDFIDRVVADNDSGLRLKYRGQNKNRYIDRINNAAGRWSEIQEYSRLELVNSIKNLEQTVQLKYGGKTKSSDKLIEEYRKVRKQLEGFEGGYIPHYLLNLLGQSIELRDRIAEVKGVGSKTELDAIMTDYIVQTQKINTQLSDRLKGRKKENTEPFTRNPMLYADKYVKDVVRFNHTTYLDLAYMKGMKDLTKVIFKNPTDQAGQAAKVYKKILEDLHSRATGRGIKDNPHADNLARIITGSQFVMKLGFSPKAGAKNWTQRVLEWVKWGQGAKSAAKNEFSENKDYRSLLNQNFEKHGLQFVDISKITQGAITLADIKTKGIDYEKGELTYTDKRTVLDMVAEGVGKVAEKGATVTTLGKGLSMKSIENSNRRSTFQVAFFQRMQQLQRLEKFSGVNSKSNPELWAEMGRQAGNYAAKWTSVLHFDYNPAGKSKLLAGKIGGSMFQFMHYSKNMLDLQATFLKDYGRAIQAGDYFSHEAGAVFRMAVLHAAAQAGNAIFDFNLTQYVDNDTMSRIVDVFRWFGADEDEKLDMFYGKGAVGATGAVPLSDMVEVLNLGVAAGYWDMLADEESAVGMALGMREYDRIDDAEFAREVALMGNIELRRLTQQTIPMFAKSGIVGALRAEFGLWPGGTTFGMKSRDVRKKAMDNAESIGLTGMYQDITGQSLVKNKKGVKGKRKLGLTKDQRRKALKSLSGI
jgi:hypothetical protein